MPVTYPVLLLLLCFPLPDVILLLCFALHSCSAQPDITRGSYEIHEIGDVRTRLVVK